MARAQGRADVLNRLLVLTAVPLEARGLARRLGLRRVTASGWPHYTSDRLEVAAVGLGAFQIGERSGHWLAPSLVISSGTCGGLVPHLTAGDLVIPHSVVGGARPHTTAPLPPLTSHGTLVTTAAVVTSPADKQRLAAATGALAVDLESAVILDWAQALGVPAAVVRGVSDAADTPIPEELLSLLTRDGTMRIGAALRAVVRRPWLLPPVIALARGTTAALDAVADALRTVAHAHLDDVCSGRE